LSQKSCFDLFNLVKPFVVKTDESEWRMKKGKV